MSPLRARMIEDMSLAGLAGGTQKIYAQAVYRLTAHYRRAPDQLSEDEVRRYLLDLRERGVARGTFKAHWQHPCGFSRLGSDRAARADGGRQFAKATLLS